MSTIKLYDEDAYKTSFSARVLSCSESEITERLQKRLALLTDIPETVKIYSLVLDKTLFFPEEGGQTPDGGTLTICGRDLPVIDVAIDKTNTISHYVAVCDGSSFQPEDSEVSGNIDFAHRFSNMQNHTGEHIFSGLVCRKKNCNNVGFHLSDDIVTMDYDCPLTKEEIDALELKANEIITKNLPVFCTYPSEEELTGLSYRSKIEIDGPVRIVTIPGVDVCACCAPHVKNTGEIGLLKVIDFMKYKGGTRLSILCGSRAFIDFRKKQEKLVSISRTLSESIENTDLAVGKLYKEKNDLSYKLRQLQGNLLSIKADSIPDNVKHAILFTEDCDVNEARKVINSLTEKRGGYCGVFTGSDESGFSFIIGSSDLDCSVLAKELREKLNAKGGGKKEMIQGHTDAKEDEIIKFFG